MGESWPLTFAVISGMQLPAAWAHVYAVGPLTIVWVDLDDRRDLLTMARLDGAEVPLTLIDRRGVSIARADRARVWHETDGAVPSVQLATERLVLG